MFPRIPPSADRRRRTTEIPPPPTDPVGMRPDGSDVLESLPSGEPRPGGGRPGRGGRYAACTPRPGPRSSEYDSEDGTEEGRAGNGEAADLGPWGMGLAVGLAAMIGREAGGDSGEGLGCKYSGT